MATYSMLPEGLRALLAGIGRYGDTFTASIDELVGQAGPQLIATGILHSAPGTLRSMGELDGSRRARTLGQWQWEQHYQDLRRGSMGDTPLPSLAELKQRARAYDRQGIVPISLVNIEHEYLTPEFVTEVRTAANEKRAVRKFDDWRDVVRRRRGFFASALLLDVYHAFIPQQPVHRGTTVRFTLDPAFYITNDTQPLLTIDMDPGDGRGTRRIAVGETIEVVYPDTGQKAVTVVAEYSGQRLQAGFTLDVRAAFDVPKWDEKWPVTAKIEYEGKTDSGTAYILFGSENGEKHTQLVRPVLIADGFPVSGDHNYDYIYEILNKENTITELLNIGYDFVILTYDDGTDLIERNGFVAVECIQMVGMQESVAYPLIVGGGSMGGVITLFALNYMLDNGLETYTGTYVSLDAPHQGAEIPVGDQFYIQVLAAEYGNSKAEEVAALLNSPAAQQLLVYLFDPGTGRRVTSPLRDRLTQKLKQATLPNIRSIGIADGAGNGEKVVPDLALTMSLDNLCADGLIRALPTDPKAPTVIAVLNDFSHQHSLPVYDTLNYDGAPGGLLNANGMLAEAIQAAGYSVSHNYDYTCFVPSASALAIETANNLYLPIPPEGAETFFDAYMTSSTNNNHVEITGEINLFLLNQLGLGQFEGNMAAIVSSDRVRRVFGVNWQQQLLELSWNGTSWGGHNLGPAQKGGGLGVSPGSLAACTRNGVSHFFSISPQQHLLHTYRTDGGQLAAWDDIGTAPYGGGIGNSVAACMGADPIDVFAVSAENHLLHAWWNNVQWSWEDLGDAKSFGGISATPGCLAACTGNNRLDVFLLSPYGHLIHTYYDGSSWHWQGLGSALQGGGLANSLACFGSQGFVNLFAVSAEGDLLHSSFKGAVWSDWDDAAGTPSLSGGLGGAIAASLYPGGLIDVYGVSGESGVLHASWNRSTWSWQAISGAAQASKKILSTARS